MKRKLKKPKEEYIDQINRLIIEDAQSLGASHTTKFRVTAERVEAKATEWLVTGNVEGAEVLGYVKFEENRNPSWSHAMWFKDTVGC